MPSRDHLDMVSLEPINAREEEDSQFYRRQREIERELEIYALTALLGWSMFASTPAPSIAMDCVEEVDIDYLVDVIEGNVKKEATKKKKEKKKKKSKQSVVGQTLDESRVGKELNDDEQEDFGCKD